MDQMSFHTEKETFLLLFFLTAQENLLDLIRLILVLNDFLGFSIPVCHVRWMQW